MLRTFKKHLKSLKGQSIIEYALVFIAFTLGVIIVFGLQGQKARQAFDNSVNSTIEAIKK